MNHVSNLSMATACKSDGRYSTLQQTQAITWYNYTHQDNQSHTISMPYNCTHQDNQSHTVSMPYNCTHQNNQSHTVSMPYNCTHQDNRTHNLYAISVHSGHANTFRLLRNTSNTTCHALFVQCWFHITDICLCWIHIANICLRWIHIADICLCWIHIADICLCCIHIADICLCHLFKTI